MTALAVHRLRRAAIKMLPAPVAKRLRAWVRSASQSSDRVRTFELAVPRPPDGATGRLDAPTSLRIKAPVRMYVPKVLARTGFGGYELTCLPHFLAALSTAPAGAVLDIGANIGPYALLAKALSTREVIAFEPTPDVAEVARDLGTSNGLPFLVEEIALGDSAGAASLYLSMKTDSSNSLNPDFRQSSGTIEVPLETLDGYLRRTSVVPGLLKVDTETTEPAVLRGAKDLIREHRPWVFCEVLFDRGEDELMSVISDWGYSWYYLDGPGPLTASTAIVGDKTYKNMMWLFTPEPLGEKHCTLAEALSRSLSSSRPASETAGTA